MSSHNDIENFNKESGERDKIDKVDQLDKKRCKCQRRVYCQ